MTRVLAIADNPLARQALVGLLEARPNTSVTALDHRLDTASSTLAALRPDLVVVDVERPDLAALVDLLAAPAVATAILVDRGRSALAVPALVAGARGFLFRDRTPAWLLWALDRVLLGEVVVDAGVAARLVRAATRGRRAEGPFGLTRQEEQVLARLAPRRTNHDIGQALGISSNTVKTHLAAAFRKLGVHDRHEAARFATTHGLA